jgi:hypothetical protein
VRKPPDEKSDGKPAENRRRNSVQSPGWEEDLGRIIRAYPCVPSEPREARKKAESQTKLLKSTRVAAFIARGGDFPLRDYLRWLGDMIGKGHELDSDGVCRFCRSPIL